MSDERVAIGQSDSAHDRRAGMRRRHRTFADELREGWWATGRAWWKRPEAWWTPAVDAVTRAVADGRDAAAAVTQLGRERAAARTGLAKSVDDLNAFYQWASGSAAPLVIVRALVTGWQPASEPELCTTSGDVMVR
jgi:hypothetical protein